VVEVEAVKIVDVRDVPALDPERLGKIDVMVTYEVEPMRVYMVRIPKEEFNEERLREEIKKDIQARAKWIGKELKL